MRQEMKTTLKIVVPVAFKRCEPGNVAGHGAGEVPSRNTPGTHSNETQQTVCYDLHLSCDCRRERRLFSRN